VRKDVEPKIYYNGGQWNAGLRMVEKCL